MNKTYLAILAFDAVEDPNAPEEAEDVVLLAGDAAYEVWLSEFSFTAQRWANLESFEVVGRTCAGNVQHVVIRLNLREEVKYINQEVYENIYYVGHVSGDIVSLTAIGR
jgi:hypothetical protein